jgi:hypothetical protein
MLHCHFKQPQEVANGPSFLASFCILAIVGYVMLIASNLPAVQYTGTFLAACGV